MNASCEIYVLAMFILTGLSIGLLFDLFRIIRRTFRTPDFLTYLEDLLFWILTAIMVLYSLFHFNSGEFRLYPFLGIGIGLSLYFPFISSKFIHINVCILTSLKKLFHTLLTFALFPIKCIFSILRKTIFKPISFICINVRKNLKNASRKMLQNVKKVKKVPKNIQEKKDFSR